MTKKESRDYFSEQREKISPNQLRKNSESICDLLFTHFNIEDKVLSCFLPIERKKEINTYIILEKAIGLQATVTIPKANFATLDLSHYIFEAKEQLILSEYGIPEPKFGKTIGIQKINIVLVPLLAVDKTGKRVGYGKGFYDRFLKKCSSQTIIIGLSLFEPIDEITDVNDNDFPLQYCITPNGIIRF